MINTYNKLVRDKIPEVIMKEGYTVIARSITNEEEAKHLLLNKLSEEKNELFNAINSTKPEKEEIIDECIDVIDVVEAIMYTCGISFTQYWEAKQAKHAEKGEFNNKVFLVEVKL